MKTLVALIKITTRIFFVALSLAGIQITIGLLADFQNLLQHLWELYCSILLIIVPVIALYELKDEPLFDEEESS